MTPAAAAASPAAPPILTTPDVPASSASDKPPPAMTCAPSATVSMPLPVDVPTDSSPLVEKLEPVPDTRAAAPFAIEPTEAELELAPPPARTDNRPLRVRHTHPSHDQFYPPSLDLPGAKKKP